MPAGAETDPLFGIIEIGLAFEIFAFEACRIDQHLLGRRFAGKGRNGHPPILFMAPDMASLSRFRAAYSAIVRSLENFPEPATFRMALRAHASASEYTVQPLVRLEVGGQVRQMHVVVAMRQQRVAQRSEEAGFVAAEMVGEDQVQRGAGLRLVLVMPVRAVPAAAVGDLIGRQAEEEEVLLAGFFGHFDRRAVARADRQRAVHHELHVAGAAGLVTGGRDLVGDVAGRDQLLGERNAVIGEEHNLEPASHDRDRRRSCRRRC